MKLLTWTVLLSVLLVFVAAAPVTENSEEGPIELTLENWKTHVSKGIWWIKFFSPYCHHCKAFAPTWSKLHKDFKDNKDINFANVNCVTQGDLCNQEDIMAYPAINLYNDAELLDSQISNTGDYFKKYITGKLVEIKGESAPEKETGDGENTEEKKADSGSASTANSKFPKFPTSTDEVNQKYPGVAEPAEKTDKESTKPNPNGKSVELDLKTFNKRVTSTRDSWFVQFYSGRISQDFQATWKQVAVSAQNKLNVGQVNCDFEVQLCKEAGVTETPMLKFFASSIQSEYRGLRGVGDLVQFLDRAISARNPKEVTVADYDKLFKSEDQVTFIYLYDKATSKEDFQALEKLAVATVGTVNIVKSKDEKLVKKLKAEQLPALIALSAEKAVPFPAQASYEIRDHNRLLEWAHENQFPLVSELSPFNSKDLFNNRLVVLAILDPRDEGDTKAALKELKTAARELQKLEQRESLEELEELRKKKQLKIDEAKDKGDRRAEEEASQIRIELTKRQKIGIAWIDGIFWERWVKERYGDNEGYKSRIVINDESTGRFWDRNWGHGIIIPSRAQILETIEEIYSKHPRVKATQLHGKVGILAKQGRNYILEHLMLTTLSFLAVLLLIVTCRRRIMGGLSTLLRERGSSSSLSSSSSEGLLGKQD
jgi:protein disulfide-isomerase